MKNTALRLGLALLASGGPMAFPLAQMGYAPLQRLAFLLILPSALPVAGGYRISGFAGRRRSRARSSKGTRRLGDSHDRAGSFRYTGFRLGFMPGDLPELMGVLLLNRFALGPSTASSVAGFVYHYWNGAALGAIFALLFMGRPRWWAVPYGLAIGLGFLASAVVLSLGVGLFGKDFGWRFAATVLTAHAAYGAALGH